MSWYNLAPDYVMERSSPAEVNFVVSDADIKFVDFIVFKKHEKLELTGIVSAPLEQIPSIQVISENEKGKKQGDQSPFDDEYVILTLQAPCDQVF